MSLELSQTLEKERRVNEELRNALDNDYEENDKTDDRQLSVVKELKMSLTAVQVTYYSNYLLPRIFAGNFFHTTLHAARKFLKNL